jgi:nifR3 family TIM-barrel protein
MISSEALVRRHPESFRLMDLGWDQRPASVQLMGGSPEVMAEAARMVEDQGADIVDINMGCPVPKVVKTSGGASLLRDPDRAARVAEAVVGAVRIPVTTKIRLGWDFPSRNYLQMARLLEAAGVQALAVHGRTRSQNYDPWADWNAIGEVKAAVRIPVAGSGDLRRDVEAAERMAQTSVDAVMLGRGILGNLWLIRQTVHHLQTGGQLPDLTWPQRIALVRRHCDLVVEYYGPERGSRLLRKFVAWGLKGFKGAPRLRDLVNSLTTPEQVDAVLDEALRTDVGLLSVSDEIDAPAEPCQAVA